MNANGSENLQALAERLPVLFEFRVVLIEVLSLSVGVLKFSS